MPRRPKSQCPAPGCGALTDGGRCPAHKRATEQARGTAAQRMYDGKWRAARAAFLAQHPLCRRCAGRGIVEPATVVDHVMPHRGDQSLFWDRANWQPLCKPCHDAKTATEDGGFGRGAGSA